MKTSSSVRYIASSIRIMKLTLITLIIGLCTIPHCLAEETAMGTYSLGENGDALVAHVIETRGRPLVDVKTEHELTAADFGAIPDDGKDDLPALRALFAKAAAQGKTKAIIGKGVYNLLSAENDADAFHIEDATDLVIEGGGAELLHGNPKSGFFRLKNCKRVILRNFIADYDPLPFTQGRIVGVDKEKRTFDFEVQEGFPLADHTFFEGRNQVFGFLMDSRPQFRGRMKPGVPHAVRTRNPKVLSERTVRLSAGAKVEAFEVGDLFVQLARSGTTQWVLYNSSEDITFQNLTIHAAGAAVFIGSACNRVNILDCKVIPRGERLISANGGGAIAQSHERGIWVEGCRFESLSDDPVNFYSKPMFPVGTEEGGGVKVVGATPERLAVGDEVAFFDSSEGCTLFHASVSESRNGVVIFTPPIDLSQVAITDDPEEKSLDVLKRFDYFMNLRLQSDYYLVKNNEFINCRGRLLLRASRGVVEGNTVRGSGMGGLVLQNDWVCPEGYRVTDTVIRNNVFEECGLTENTNGMSAITSIRVPREDDPFDAPSDHRQHQNILITGNTFKNWFRSPALSIHGVEQLQLTGNTFIQETGHPYFKAKSKSVIEVDNSGHVTVDGNTNETSAEEFVVVDDKSNDVVVKP